MARSCPTLADVKKTWGEDSCVRTEAEAGARGQEPRTARGHQELDEAGRILPWSLRKNSTLLTH